MWWVVGGWINPLKTLSQGPLLTFCKLVKDPELNNLVTITSNTTLYHYALLKVKGFILLHYTWALMVSNFTSLSLSLAGQVQILIIPDVSQCGNFVPM